MIFPITAIYAALLAVTGLVLMFHVVFMRGKTGISILHGEDMQLAQAMRRHGNFIEQVPLVLILMGLVEANGGNATLLHVLGAVLVIARIAQPFGLHHDRMIHPLRAVGTVGTVLPTVVLIGVALWQVIAGGQLVAAPAAAQEGNVMTAEQAYAAGLMDEPIPKLVIPLDELVSKEDLLARIAEHVGGIERTGGNVRVAEPFMPADVARILEAIEADDDDRLREVLSEITGTAVTLPSDDHLRRHDEGAIYKTRERYTTDQILARMRPERVEALADYRHLLDDEWELIDALTNGNLDSPTRSAVREFLAKVYEPEPIESLMPPELKEQIRQAQERGWYEVGFPARGPRLLREASQRELARSSLSAYGEWIPETAASYSFDLRGDGRIEVVADTIFGGLLYAEKSEADGVHPDDPNLRILGHDGSVTTSRYADGVWATTVIAFDGSHKYRITLEKKLEGDQRDEFVRMATAMIEGDLSR